jgi:hypothetical protein
MEGTIENLKGFVTFLREGIIVVVLLLFLLLPKVMNGVLERAGFQTASLAGFEWKLHDSVDQTKAASDNVDKLQQQLTTLSARLDQLSQSPAAPPGGQAADHDPLT